MEEKICEDTTKIFSDGASCAAGVGAAAVFYKGKRVLTQKCHLGAHGKHSGFEAEMAALILGLDFARREPMLDVGVSQFTDCQETIHAINGVAHPLGHPLVTSYRLLLNNVLEKHNLACVKLRWVPGHSGVAGNEAADAAANLAARDKVDCMELPPRRLRNALSCSLSES